MRKSKVKTLTGVIITMGVVLAVTGTSTVLLKQNLDRQTAAYEELYTQTVNNTHTVYVAMCDEESGGIVKSGTILEEGVNVEKVSVFTSLPESSYMGEDDLGKPLINDVPDGMPIYQTMVAQDGAKEGDREYNVLVANLMESLKDNEYIDVRIMFPNGDDYCILPKKCVKDLNLETASFTCLMNEEEILRMASATVDAYMISGSYIYTVRYADGTISEESTPTYPVRANTMTLIKQDPNVLTEATETLNMQARANLESRLANMTKEQVTAVTGGTGVKDNADNSVLIEGARSYEDKSSDGQSNILDSYNWTFEFSDDYGMEETESTEMEEVTEEISETSDAE